MIAPPRLRDLIKQTWKEIPAVAWWGAVIFILVNVAQCVGMQ